MKDEDILSRVAPQQNLFPRHPKEVCKEIGLQWWAALRLARDGYLSYDPEAIERLDEAQEAELAFVGSIAATDCDRRMLDYLLAGLEKPYCYRHDRIRYDWHQGKWVAIPLPEDVAEEGYERLKKAHDSDAPSRLESLRWDAVSDLIEDLRDSEDSEGLRRLGELVSDATRDLLKDEKDQEHQCATGTGSGGAEIVAGHSMALKIAPPEHPLNLAAKARLVREKLPEGNMPVIDLAFAGLSEDKDLQGHEPEALRLANAQRPKLQANSLALLEQAGITPEDVQELPLAKLADMIIDALTPGPPCDPDYNANPAPGPQIIQVAWEEVEAAADVAFKVWVGQPELVWARKAWEVLGDEGLTGYNTELERHVVMFRFLVLAAIYRDFCQAAWQEQSSLDYSYWAETLSIADFVVGQLYSQMPDWDGNAETVSEAVEIIAESYRHEIVSALLNGFGGETGLYQALWRSKDFPDDSEDDADDTDNPWDESNVDCHTGYEWIDQGCPRLG